MISKYKLIDDTLFLYFDFNYEFGDFNIPKGEDGYINTIKNYIKNIGYKGTKVVLMVGTIVVAVLAINNSNPTSDYEFKLLNSEKEIQKLISNEVVELNDDLLYSDINDLNKNFFAQNNEEDKTNETISEINNNQNNDIQNNNVEKNDIQNNDIVSELPNEENNDLSIFQDENINKGESNDLTNIDNNLSDTEVKEENKNLISLVHNGNTINIELEDYVIGVVAAEMPASFHIEALKAQSVIARTYALNKLSKGITLTDNNSTQNYIDIDQMRNKWGIDFDKYYNKIKDAVLSTEGTTIKYNNEYIDAVYFSTSNGYTEDSINVWENSIPYLKSVESSWDRDASSFSRTQTIDLNNFNLKLGTNISSGNEISIIERNSSSRVSKISVGDKIFSGVQFRNILGLRSADFDIEFNDNILTITTRGYGHGVGMSQYGANGMAKNGYDYKQILAYYYKNVSIN